MERETNSINCREVYTSPMFDIRKAPVMSNDESVKYGEAITLLREELSKFGDVKSFDDGKLSVPKEAKYIYDEYCKHSNSLAEGHLKLISYVLKKHQYFKNHCQDEICDFVSNAQIELIRSARNYNPWNTTSGEDSCLKNTEPLKFSSYATNNIRYSIINSIKDNNVVRIPRNNWKHYRSFRETELYFMELGYKAGFEWLAVSTYMKENNGEYPKYEELVKYFNSVNNNINTLKMHKIIINRYKNTYIFANLKSLNSLTVEEPLKYTPHEAQDAHDLYIDGVENIPSPYNLEDEIVIKERKEKIIELFNRFWPPDSKIKRSILERKVLEMRHEIFGNDEEKTLKEIGDHLKVTPEYIRQILRRAYRRFRHPTIMYYLSEIT